MEELLKRRSKVPVSSQFRQCTLFSEDRLKKNRKNERA
jgi:hypothetical protein